ncbi:hypothetical protein GBA52_006367 [Prunus armeniaca]|nr:hypothetical protein GBA52_006367 [Prunus armeniaca]
MEVPQPIIPQLLTVQASLLAGITFSNTAGPTKGPCSGAAVGLRPLGLLPVCAFQGYQDTLMCNSQRQFYRECYIYGTIDLILATQLRFPKLHYLCEKALEGPSQRHHSPSPKQTHIKTLQFQSIILKFGPLQISSP